MNEPVKVILKYKNNHKKIQYLTYVFIGIMVEPAILTILYKIQKLGFYDSLISLTNYEITLLETNYGEYWYSYFFITSHLEFSKELVSKSKTQKQAIVDKFTKDYFQKHFVDYIKQSIKSNYSYASMIGSKNTKQRAAQLDNNEIADFRIKSFSKPQIGKGSNENRLISEDNVPSANDDDKDDDEAPYVNQDEISANDVDGETNQEDDQEDIDIEALERVIDTNHVDSKIDEVQKLINDTVKQKKKSQHVKFDAEKDENQFEDNLTNVIHKYYIKSNYIDKEDTIATIRKKICMSIKNNDKFSLNGDPVNILPNHQYLWSQYRYHDITNNHHKLDKIMLGQLWVRKSELLLIEIEPDDNMYMYEELKSSLPYLKDNMNRYSAKIRLDKSDENKCLYDYMPYMQNNEIYMVDIYNELGIDYKPTKEQLENVYAVYVSIYFPNITFDEFKDIIAVLNKQSDNTVTYLAKNKSIAQQITQDITVENEITKTVQETKRYNINKYFQHDNHIIQSTTHINLIVNDLSLYRIMDNYILSEQYPFIQYIDSQHSVVKVFNKDKNYIREKISPKFFESEQSGLNFRIITGPDRHIHIKLSNKGRVEYKTSMKEEDKITIQDIKLTHVYVNNLIDKINSENIYQSIPQPNPSDFNFAYINTIQKFTLPGSHLIKHNDLSDFVRFFYPYITIVIDPKKRESKDKSSTSGKYGTYFRYRKISMYDNDSRIEHRIRYFYKNYEFTNESLANEISNIFNVTIPQAMKHIQAYREKYPYIKRSRKALKNIEQAPKYKPPGIEISIQGRTRDKYKVRITGARNQAMLERIIEFYKVMIYLYIDTYILKKKDRQSMLETLKKLKNIAKRRNKVIEIVHNDDGVVKNIKKMGALDKGRFAFKPDQNQNQYSRSCQVSGEMNRRPTGYTEVDDLVRDGFVLNEKTKQYELTTTIKTGKKITKHVLTAVMLKDNNDKAVYYTCTPQVNNEYIYVDFLSKSHNPSDKCMPCCYKKNPLLSANKKRVNYYKKCVGYDVVATSSSTQDLLYILQDTDKLPPDRLGVLPPTLDIFFNRQHSHQYTLKNHNLHKTDVFYFKYGVQQNKLPFMTLVANAFDKKIDTVQSTIRQALLGKGTSKHSRKVIFSCLRAGEIKTQFETPESYLEYIERPSSEHQYLFDILTLPGIIHPDGINIIILCKLVGKSANASKKEDDYVVECHHPIDACNKNPKTVIIVKDGPYYHAVYRVVKTSTTTRTIALTKHFDQSTTAMSELNKYFDFNCNQKSAPATLMPTMMARTLYCNLLRIEKQHHPVSQVLDVVNKCIYLCLRCGLYLPTQPSGGVVTLSINNTISPTLYFKESITMAQKISATTGIHPIGILYQNSPDKPTNLTVIGIITETYHDNQQYGSEIGLIPVKQETSSLKSLQNIANSLSQTKQIFVTNKSIYKYQYIDNDIVNKPKQVTIDRRILQVNEKAYRNESYQRFRLECSDILNINERYKKYIRKVNNDAKIDDKKYVIRKILYKALNAKLYEKYTKYYKDTGNIRLNNLNSFHIITDKEYSLMDFSDYILRNIRMVCRKSPSKPTCNASLHCRYINGKCKFSITQTMFIEFVNRITQEIMQKGITYYEIMQESIYRVSDIIDTNHYTRRQNQLIIETTNDKTQKLAEIYGDAAPMIGKRRIRKIQHQDIEEDYITKGTYALQRIVPHNDTIFRTIANCLYWLNNAIYHPSDRNIGFVSTVQTDFTNFLKKQFIEYISRHSPVAVYSAIKDIYSMNKAKFKSVIKTKIHTIVDNQYHLIELYVMHIIYSIPIVVCFDAEKIEYCIDNKQIYNGKNYPAKFNDPVTRMKSINIKLEFLHNTDTPMHIYAMLF